MELLIVLGVVAVVGFFLVVIYNRLVRLRAAVKQAFADIDTQIRQRSDLVPQLAETVKAFASHEQKVLTDVIQARNAASNARTPEDLAAADGMMRTALGGIFALAEAYPELRSNTNFVELQKELSDIENKIAAARRFLNLSVAEYNAAIQQFPAVLFARVLGFAEEASFEIPASRRAEEDRPPALGF